MYHSTLGKSEGSTEKRWVFLPIDNKINYPAKDSVMYTMAKTYKSKINFRKHRRRQTH